jgi:hypothetical protein
LPETVPVGLRCANPTYGSHARLSRHWKAHKELQGFRTSGLWDRQQYDFPARHGERDEAERPPVGVGARVAEHGDARGIDESDVVLCIRSADALAGGEEDLIALTTAATRHLGIEPDVPVAEAVVCLSELETCLSSRWERARASTMAGLIGLLV